VINICIHGHFYQPPRENPWTGEIEEQSSAKPYHDWNERIYEECYKPNTEADIVDDEEVTVLKVNNYEFLNFNFGPTLLAWIKQKHPGTYEKIIEADRISINEHNGHGNAIAMCYNHIIMPLANLNDKITQVRWGLADFKYHFKRDAEAIWLPETAVNYETLEVLISERVEYIILDSSQAAFCRPLGTGEWIDVNDGSIFTGVPYRCFSELHRDKFIDVFFYDGPVSKSVAFDDVLSSSQNLLKKIFAAENKKTAGDRLVSVATDGETFGHHKRHAERTLAFFLRSLAPQNNFKIVNYGEYLALHSPENEVKLKEREGTSWSCIHGVKRWKEDCGCGGGGGWHQKWRKPLRDSLDILRDRLTIIYENLGNAFFQDVWKARNEYIELILDSSDEKKEGFFAANSPGVLAEPEKEAALKLLEMQKFSMLMFTSCGWFFSEISGIETVKILEYASRAMELAHELTGIDLEAEFISKLSEAPSNIPKYNSGKGVYEMLVKHQNR
jgi:alpha-amylase/alpha-mannosidase (GH57 family)